MRINVNASRLRAPHTGSSGRSTLADGVREQRVGRLMRACERRAPPVGPRVAVGSVAAACLAARARTRSRLLGEKARAPRAPRYTRVSELRAVTETARIARSGARECLPRAEWSHGIISQEPVRKRSRLKRPAGAFAALHSMRFRGRTTHWLPLSLPQEYASSHSLDLFLTETARGDTPLTPVPDFGQIFSIRT